MSVALDISKIEEFCVSKVIQFKIDIHLVVEALVSARGQEPGKTGESRRP